MELELAGSWKLVLPPVSPQTAATGSWRSPRWPSRRTRTAAASPWRCPTRGDSSSPPSEWQTCCSTSPRWKGDRATASRRSTRWEEPFFMWLSREVALTRGRSLGEESCWFSELLFLTHLLNSFLYDFGFEGRILQHYQSLESLC